MQHGVLNIGVEAARQPSSTSVPEANTPKGQLPRVPLQCCIAAWTKASAWVFTSALVFAVATPGNAQPANLPSGMTQQIALAVMPSFSRVEAGGREVLLIFPDQVSRGDIAALERAAGTGLIEGVSSSEDTARLRLTRPGLARLETEGRGAVLIVQPAGRGGASWSDRRVASVVVEAEAAMRAGDTATARATIAPLLDAAPRDTALIERIAAIQAGAVRSRSAMAMDRLGLDPGAASVVAARRSVAAYERALGLDPGASSLVTNRPSLAAQQRPFLRSEAFTAAAPGGERMSAYLLSGGTPFSDGWRADFRSEFRSGRARNLRQSGQDASGPFLGEAVRGEIGVERRWEGVGNSRLAILGGPRTAGVAAQQNLRVGAVELAASFDYNRPYWDTLMSFAAEAVRHQAILGGTFPVGQQVVVQASGGYVRYGVPGNSNVAEGPAFRVTVNWTAPERWMLLDGWQFRAGYRFAAEYLSSIATGPNQNGPTKNGQMLPLLDVRSREGHGLEGVLEGPVGPAQVTLLGGYAIDRYGGSGPLGLMRIANRSEGPFAYGIEGAVGPSLAENARAVWRVGGFLAWRPGS